MGQLPLLVSFILAAFLTMKLCWGVAFFLQQFEDGDSVMAEKGFQIQDILPLGVSLSIPPFLGSNSQMCAEDVIKTQQKLV